MKLASSSSVSSQSVMKEFGKRTETEQESTDNEAKITQKDIERLKKGVASIRASLINEGKTVPVAKTSEAGKKTIAIA